MKIIHTEFSCHTFVWTKAIEVMLRYPRKNNTVEHE